VGAATEIGGEEDGGDLEESREKGEIRDDRFRLNLGSLIFNR
jgi:hypothetical protein